MPATIPASSHALPASGLPLRFRAALAIAGLCGLAYLLLEPLVDGPWRVLMKGSGVSLLAVAALQIRADGQGRANGSGWLAAVMALGALGDVLLALPGLFLAGAASFGAGHLVAMLFYRRHLRRLGQSDAMAAFALIAYGLAMPLVLAVPGMPVAGSIAYALLLTGMAACLWLSRFPRLAALGAFSFVLSDTLLVWRMGGVLITPMIDGALVWASYFAGQWLITLGVGRGLLARAQHGG